MVIRVPDLRPDGGRYDLLEDRLLVLDFQAGHPEAFVEIHRRYAGLARHVCQRFLSNQQDVDEAFQETMIRVFQGLYRFNGRYALQPWIARIATNVSLDLIRSQARRPQLDDRAIEDHDREDPAEDPEEALERFVQRDLVLSVLADLPETHRRALVYRELEGLSHKEMAEVMEMTPSQAKALIHRAKGSFRRTWMEKVVRRGGVAGIALVPVLWMVHVAGAVRRLGERVSTVAGASEVATSAAATTTAAAPAAMQTGERIVAAAVTVLVAGGVTLGAATIGRDRAAREEPVAEPAPPVAVSPAPQSPVVLPSSESDREPKPTGPSDTKEGDGPEVEGMVVAPEPSGSPTAPTDATPTPSSDPSASPSPSEDPSPPPPVIPPAPAWSGSATVDWTSDDECGCGGALALGTSNAAGQVTSDGGALDVWQSFSGGVLDAEGDAAWIGSGEVQARLTDRDGSIELLLRLEKEGTSYSFRAIASAASVNGAPGDGHPLVYALYGSYTLDAGDPDTSPIPTSGSFAAKLTVWADGATLYGIELLLQR